MVLQTNANVFTEVKLRPSHSLHLSHPPHPLRSLRLKHISSSEPKRNPCQQVSRVFFGRKERKERKEVWTRRFHVPAVFFCRKERKGRKEV
ncbi:MAG: hypothetical protein ACI4R9_08060 [Kiritimatiellia bacterium]